jgi:hypothetical protein
MNVRFSNKYDIKTENINFYWVLTIMCLPFYNIILTYKPRKLTPKKSVFDADSEAKQLPKILENYYNFDSIILIKTR